MPLQIVSGLRHVDFPVSPKTANDLQAVFCELSMVGTIRTCGMELTPIGLGRTKVTGMLDGASASSTSMGIGVGPIPVRLDLRVSMSISRQLTMAQQARSLQSEYTVGANMNGRSKI